MTTPWIILILAFPIMGVSLYLLVGLNGAPNKMRARFEEVDSMLLPCLPENADILSDMYEKVPQAAEFQHTGKKCTISGISEHG